MRKKGTGLIIGLIGTMVLMSGCVPHVNEELHETQRELQSNKKENSNYVVRVDALMENIRSTVSQEDYEAINVHMNSIKGQVGEDLTLDEMPLMEPVMDRLIYYELDPFIDHYEEGQYDVSWAAGLVRTEDYTLLVELAKEAEDLEYDSQFENADMVWTEIDAILSNYEEEIEAHFGDEEIPLVPSNFYETYAAYDIQYDHYRYSEDPYDYIDEYIPTIDALDHFIYMYWWHHIDQLFPDDYMKYLVGYDLTSDGWGGDYAMVWQDYDDERKWHLTVDPADVIDEEGNYNLYLLDETLVHEFCHILTLNHTQMKRRMNENSDTYTTDEGTLLKASYLNQFYQRFWSDIADGYGVESDYIDAYDEERLYEDYPESFVTEYAASHPAEDIAESFIYFVTLDKPEGATLKDEKIRFFYAYPELIEMREEMRKHISFN